MRAPHRRLRHRRDQQREPGGSRCHGNRHFLLERRLSEQPALRPLRTWKPDNDTFSLSQDAAYIERQAWANLGHAYTWAQWREAPTRERAEIVAHYLERNLRSNYEDAINKERAEKKATEEEERNKHKYK